MKTIKINKKDINPADFIKRSALKADCSIFIDESVKILDSEGRIKILYFKIPETVDTSKIRWAVKNIKYSKNIRTGGLETTSAIFGYSPRNILRKDFCSATAMAKSEPKQHQIICDFAEELSRIYEEHIPDVYFEHAEITKVKVKKQWKIKETPFTSGIVNKNNPLKYHFDSGNFTNVYSNMIVFKEGVEGGHLACPEYGITLDCSDNSVVMFDGQNILHGVTPIYYRTKESYRYSVVYYSLKQMWNCLTVDEELIRIRKLRIERENKRVTKKNDK